MKKLLLDLYECEYFTAQCISSPHFWRRSSNNFIGLLLYVSDVMLTNGGGSRNVNSGGLSQDDDHFSHEMFRRRLIEFSGAFGFRL